jgi:molecular chaperone DnaK (HSP70)
VGNSARKSLIETPERVIYSVKRLMGRGLEEIQSELKMFPFRLADDVEAGEVPRIQLGELRFTPPEISAYILRQLKRNAERFFGAPVTQAVITVPAYFNDAQRQATKDAGRMAGLEVLRLVNEPTAAALAYGLDRAKAGTIAVYDLGGGTFDISILKLRDGIFEVQSTNGDTHLGGDDIDNLLLAIALDEIYAEHGVDLRGHPGAVPPSNPRFVSLPNRRPVSTSSCPTATATSARFRSRSSNCLLSRCWRERPVHASRRSRMPVSLRKKLTKSCLWADRRVSQRCVS